MTEGLEETLGRAVRSIWLEWAREQPDVGEHPNWVLPWEKLDERDKEADRRIGVRLYEMGFFNAVREAKAAVNDVRPL